MTVFNLILFVFILYVIYIVNAIIFIFIFNYVKFALLWWWHLYYNKLFTYVYKIKNKLFLFIKIIKKIHFFIKLN
jgi:hypothetical protein